MFRKLILSFSLFAFIFAFSLSFGTKVANAQQNGPWFNQNFSQYYTKVFDTGNELDIFGERYTYAQVRWVIWSLMAHVIDAIDLILKASNAGFGDNAIFCIVAGDTTRCVSDANTGPPLAQTVPEKKSSLEYFKEIVFADRPISAISYFKHAAQRVTSPSTAFAQSSGAGFQALNPIQQWWVMMRNISYSLFILIFIVFSFMIMFRVKISPQTAITVQSALPRIIVALILVTFSYAIAGLLIDLMYVFFGLLSLMLGGATDLEFLVRGPTVTLLGVNASGVLAYALAWIVAFFIGFLAIIFNMPWFQAIIAGIIGLVILFFIFVLALIYAFKAITTLLRIFATILLLTIFAPIQITLGVFVPGIGFSDWFKTYISNLAVFPIVSFLFVLSTAFIFGAVQGLVIDPPVGPTINVDQVVRNFYGADYSKIPAINTTTSVQNWPPLLDFGVGMEPILFLAASFVVLTFIPKAAEIAQNLIKGRPFTYGFAIGEAAGEYQGVNKFTGGRLGAANLPGRAVTAVGSGVWNQTGGRVLRAASDRNPFNKGK